MNKVFCLIIFTLLLTNCSEGDIIENDTNFDASLENCSNLNDNTFVFYKIDDDINRSLSVNFTSPTFDITPEVNDISVTTPTTITLNDDSNQLIYREFSSAITGSDYFCSSIPSSDITITEELISSDGIMEVSYEELDPTSNTQRRYTRTVVVRNATLIGNGIVIRNELLVLGSDIIDADVSIDFTGELQICPETVTDTFTLYTLNAEANKAITLDFTSTTFEITPLAGNISEDQIETIELSTASNQLVYREFDTSIPEADTAESLCNNNLPGSISVTRELTSNTGSIEISYQELDPVDNKRRFRRTYTMKNIALEGSGNPVQIETLVLGTEEISIE
ncbi:hypothetical protein [Aquimarina sp. 2304DJ70-9]|uniref:hypothetical protein n=1 Tax=Aquimarina penaris TaxID=3231044 RepID=UPI003462B552